MYGDKAISLLKELDRGNDFLAPYNAKLVREVMDEMSDTFDKNADVLESGGETEDTMTCVHVRHGANLFNKRALLAYHFQRLLALKRFRWEFGRELPETILQNLSEEEKAWFTRYCNILGLYMKRLMDGQGSDLTVGQKPPKRLYIQVRCLKDYGDYELEDGTILVLNKGSTYFLQRSQCEKLIQMAVLEQIS